MDGSKKGDPHGADEQVAGSADKGPGYLDREVVGCQFSVYPLRQDDLGPAVRTAVAAAYSEGCSVRVGNLSTLLTGNEEQVFRALRAAFRAVQRHGSAVMTATLAAGMPTDELVGEIQSTVDAQDSPSSVGSS
jgi:uncharacterized protein YqgV (UPF0045/DUF77 family)